MANQKAIEAGTEDANTWINENEASAYEACADSREGADEALINAMGSAFVAKLFGVENASDEFSAACGDYSEAFRKTVRGAIDA